MIPGCFLIPAATDQPCGGPNDVRLGLWTDRTKRREKIDLQGAEQEYRQALELDATLAKR